MFKLKKHENIEVQANDPVEARFDDMMDLIKDLPRADYNRLKEAMDLGYKAYQKVRNIKTDDDDDIVVSGAEFVLTQEEK